MVRSFNGSFIVAPQSRGDISGIFSCVLNVGSPEVPFNLPIPKTVGAPWISDINAERDPCLLMLLVRSVTPFFCISTLFWSVSEAMAPSVCCDIDQEFP